MGQCKEHLVINNRFLHLNQPSHELKCSSISFRTMNAPIFSHKFINDGPNPSWTVARNLPWPETWPEIWPETWTVARYLGPTLSQIFPLLGAVERCVYRRSPSLPFPFPTLSPHPHQVYFSSVFFFWRWC